MRTYRLNEDHVKGPCIVVNLLILGLVFAESIMTIVFFKSEYQNIVGLPNTDYFNQVARDWDTLPFTGIQIYDYNNSTMRQCPDEYPEPVF